MQPALERCGLPMTCLMVCLDWNYDGGSFFCNSYMVINPVIPAPITITSAFREVSMQESKDSIPAYLPNRILGTASCFSVSMSGEDLNDPHHKKFPSTRAFASTFGCFFVFGVIHLYFRHHLFF